MLVNFGWQIAYERETQVKKLHPTKLRTDALGVQEWLYNAFCLEIK